MPRHIFIYKLSIFAFLAAFFACTNVADRDGRRSCVCAVLDVGEGLAQICAINGAAIAFDVGDTLAGNQWASGYGRVGSPRINAIVISHTHQDHMGGLSHLPPALDFSGMIITHPYEDTAYIRKIAGQWRQDVYFKTIAQGDTIGGLEGVRVECIWPPRDINAEVPLDDTLKNRYSLCCILRYDNTSVIITSDVDTFSERTLAAQYGETLAADIIVVPHHGSAGSVDEVFYGYVNPSVAIISCGIANSYGFPTQKATDLLYQMKVTEMVTYSAGTIAAVSNGSYWTF